MSQVDSHPTCNVEACHAEFGILDKSSVGNDILDLGIPESAVSGYVLGIPQGSVRILGGIDNVQLRLLLARDGTQLHERRALSVQISSAPTTAAIVEQVLDRFAETARNMWPIWCNSVDFTQCENNTIGLRTAEIISREAAKRFNRLSPSWLSEAAKLALASLRPRVSETPVAIELAQLGLVLGGREIVVVVDLHEDSDTRSNAMALVYGLQSIAEHAQVGVCLLLPELPPNEPPFERILYGARHVASYSDALSVSAAHDVTYSSHRSVWIEPWRGQPHPLSEVEQRLAKVLAADAELGNLFHFNQTINTVRGTSPIVDLFWKAGRLVVELDGYGSHGNRASFMHDRHRDYELTLSGFTVLRLANDEVRQDYEKAIEKIRDLVRMRRTQIDEEGERDKKAEKIN